MTKLKKKLKLWRNSKTKIVPKLKNPNPDKTQVVTKLKLWQNSNFDKIKKNSNCDKTQKLKMWQLVLLQILIYEEKKKNVKGYFNKNILAPWQPMRCSLGSVLKSCNIFQGYFT